MKIVSYYFRSALIFYMSLCAVEHEYVMIAQNQRLLTLDNDTDWLLKVSYNEKLPSITLDSHTSIAMPISPLHTQLVIQGIAGRGWWNGYKYAADMTMLKKSKNNVLLRISIDDRNEWSIAPIPLELIDPQLVDSDDISFDEDGSQDRISIGVVPQGKRPSFSNITMRLPQAHEYVDAMHKGLKVLQGRLNKAEKGSFEIEVVERAFKRLREHACILMRRAGNNYTHEVDTTAHENLDHRFIPEKLKNPRALYTHFFGFQSDQDGIDASYHDIAKLIQKKVEEHCVSEESQKITSRQVEYFFRNSLTKQEYDAYLTGRLDELVMSEKDHHVLLTMFEETITPLQVQLAEMDDELWQSKHG